MGNRNTKPPSPLTTALPTVLQTHICTFLTLSEVAYIVQTCRTLAIAAARERCRRCVIRTSADIPIAPARRRGEWWWQRLLYAPFTSPLLLDAPLSTPLTHHVTALTLHQPPYDPSLSTYYDCRQFASLTSFRSLERLQFFLGREEPSERVLTEVFQSLAHTIRYLYVSTTFHSVSVGSSPFYSGDARVQLLLHSLPLLTHLRSLTLHISWGSDTYTHIDFSPLLCVSSLRFLTMSLPDHPVYSVVDPLLLHWFNQQLQVIHTLAQRLVYADFGRINSSDVRHEHEEAIIAALAPQAAELSPAPAASPSATSSSSFSSPPTAVGTAAFSSLPTVGIQHVGSGGYMYHRSLSSPSSLLFPHYTPFRSG